MADGLDVEPLFGEEAKSLQLKVIEDVKRQFKNDETKLLEFTRMSQQFGNGKLPSAGFYVYLKGAFGERKAKNIAPYLARLIHDDVKRRGLMAACTEPATMEAVPPPAPDGGRPPSLTEQLQGVSLAAKDGIISDEQKAVIKDQIIQKNMKKEVRFEEEETKASEEDVFSAEGEEQNALEAMLQMGFTVEQATSALLKADGSSGGDQPSDMTRIERAIEIAFREQDEVEQSEKRKEELLSRDMRGWLLKTDPSGTKFTRRFCVLRRITGSLCYYESPSDLVKAKGVIPLFDSKLARAPSKEKQLAAAKRWWPTVVLECGFQIITPRRTFVFYGETPEETEDWRDAINAVQSFLVPEEYSAGSEVTHEVFENHRYQVRQLAGCSSALTDVCVFCVLQPISGWSPDFNLLGERQRYSDQDGSTQLLFYYPIVVFSPC
jgi:hypothetical protein